MKWERIKGLRIDMDLTQKELGEILHCHREVYRRYESGERELPLQHAVILADFYHISLDYLIGRSDVKSPLLSETYLPVLPKTHEDLSSDHRKKNDSA